MELMRARAPGAEFVRVDAPVYNPIFEMFGTVDPDSPATRAWEEAVQEYRRRRDEEEEAAAADAGGAA